MNSTEYQRIDTAWIPLSDGTQLAATIWLPENALEHPVPAILEYLPYRRRDGMVLRDQQMHGYFAQNGYAGVRVDIRGSGDSDGILADEYLPQEQADAVEVIAWLAAQSWCSGTVGMMGISWGGFNALQVASHRPPALKAIITVCSTDDRYADDCHFMGGTLLLNSFAWGSIMFAYGAQPPDPAVVGAEWRRIWLERLHALPLFADHWIRQQRRGPYWQQGSVCEDYGSITAAVLAVGGWADGYSNTVPRMVSNLTAPTRGLIGPWGHAYPHIAHPGPAIGFLQEAVRWWDHWLKGIDNGVMDAAPMRVWMQEGVRPATTYPERPGRWLSVEDWPVAEQVWHLGAGTLQPSPAAGRVLVASPLATGLTLGEWCPYGMEGELPQDQRPDDGRSVCFDQSPLTERTEILGAPIAELTVIPGRTSGHIALRLEDVAADGASTLVTYGLLNLTHHQGHAVPQPLLPGEPIRIRVALNDIAYAFPVGHRIRLAIASAHWPIAWPGSEMGRFELELSKCRLLLPVRDPAAQDGPAPDFGPPEEAKGVAVVLHKQGGRNRTITEDPTTGRVAVTVHRERASYDLPEFALSFAATSAETYSLIEGDPTSASTTSQAEWSLSGEGWATRTQTRSVLTCDREAFYLNATLRAYDGKTLVVERDWSTRIPRDGV